MVPLREAYKCDQYRAYYLQQPAPGGGGTLIFSLIRRLGLFFGVQNSEFQYFWGFQKNEYFVGV